MSRKPLAEVLYLRDLNENCRADYIRGWLEAGRKDLVEASMEGADILIGGYYLDDADIKIVG